MPDIAVQYQAFSESMSEISFKRTLENIVIRKFHFLIAYC